MKRTLSRRTGIGIAGKVGAPLNISTIGKGTSGDSVAADGAEDTGVRDLGRRGNDAVGDHVVDGLMWDISYPTEIIRWKSLHTLCSSCLTS